MARVPRILNASTSGSHAWTQPTSDVTALYSCPTGYSATITSINVSNITVAKKQFRIGIEGFLASSNYSWLVYDGILEGSTDTYGAGSWTWEIPIPLLVGHTLVAQSTASNAIQVIAVGYTEAIT